MLGLGISLATLSLAAGLRGVIAALPSIQLSQSSVAENAANGAVIGTLSVVNGTGTWTFTKTADPDAKFGLSGASLTKAAAVDYETKTAHSVTIQATNGTSTITRTFSIGVVNALEVTLSSLGLSATKFAPSAQPGTVIGTVSGLVDGSSWAVFPNDGRVAKSGNNLVVGLTQSTGDFSITLRHTHPDAVNSPLDAVVPLTVTAPIDSTAPTITSSAAHSVAENSAYSATATANEAVTWAKGGLHAALVTLNASTGAWSVPAQDFETQPSVSFTLTATDAAGNASTQSVTLTITDVNEPPAGEASYFTATPSAPNADENALSGAELASMTAYFRPIQTTATANENTLNGAEILILEA